MITFYIASRLENAAQVRELRDLLTAAGWTCAYDWTAHGSVRSDDGDPAARERITEVAAAEVIGAAADVFIALLPGGRGTHVEIGVAIATHWDNPASVVLWSPQSEVDFGTSKETSAFYHHPLVTQRSDATMAELAAWLQTQVDVELTA